MTRDDIMAEARKWVGTPYRQKGRGGDGLDCIGLVVVVAQALGLQFEDRLDYTDWPSQDHQILKVLGQYLKFVPPNAANKAGLVGVFIEQRLPGHVGILTTKHGADHVVHARLTLGARRVTEDALSNVRGELRLIATYAFPGLE